MASDKTPRAEVVRHDRDGVPVYQVGALEVRNYATMTEAVRTFVSDVADKVTGSSEDAVLDIVAGILSADTLDKILSPGDVRHSQEAVGSVFTIHAVKWARSSFGEGLPFYAILTVSGLDDDKTDLLSCSATNVMAQVWSMDHHGLLPATVMLVESKRPTPDGYRPMRLVPADAESF